MTVLNRSLFVGETDKSPPRHKRASQYEGKTFLHQPRLFPTEIDQFVTVLRVGQDGTARVRGERGGCFCVPLATLKKIPEKAAPFEGKTIKFSR